VGRQVTAPTFDELAATDVHNTLGWGLRCRAGDHEDPAWPAPGVVSCTCTCHTTGVASW